MTSILALLAFVNIALIAFPLLVAIPFVRQTAWLLAAARSAWGSARAVSGLSAGFAIALAMWSGFTWSAAAPIALLLGCVAASRGNTFEWIFAAPSGVETAPAASFRDIADCDMVIGVVLGGESRAYPVRYLAHHHLVNDQLGGATILPTY